MRVPGISVITRIYSTEGASGESWTGAGLAAGGVSKTVRACPPRRGAPAPPLDPRSTRERDLSHRPRSGPPWARTRFRCPGVQALGLEAELSVDGSPYREALTRISPEASLLSRQMRSAYSKSARPRCLRRQHRDVSEASQSEHPVDPAGMLGHEDDPPRGATLGHGGRVGVPQELATAFRRELRGNELPEDPLDEVADLGPFPGRMRRMTNSSAMGPTPRTPARPARPMRPAGPARSASTSRKRRTGSSRCPPRTGAPTARSPA